MDYRTIVEKHPDRYVIAAVAERGENNFVSSWEVLSADSKSFNEAKEKLKFFESEGVKGCCIINTYADPYGSSKPIGAKFEVDFVDDALQLQGRWLPPESGSIAILIEEDSFKIVN